MQRLLARAAVVIAVVALGAVSAVYLVAHSRLPTVDGSRPLPGLAADVRVRRDGFGVPHIEASSEADAWTAVGFVHGQDRFFQMDLARRKVSGRLSELFGEVAIRSDRRNLTRRLRATAIRQLAELPEDDRRLLDRYAAGVNAGVEDTGRPLECLLLRYRPRPWTALDSMLLLKSMEDLLALDGGERRRDRLTVALGADLASYLYDFQGLLGTTILGDAELPVDPAEEPAPGPAGPSTPGTSAAPAADPSSTSAPRADGPTPGSNSWTVAGTRTASGRPLLANDTHLPAAAPSIWYEVHIRFPGVDTVGLTIPGEPYPIIGHNGRVAWGVTTLVADQVDYYRLELHPDDPDRFRWGGEWREFEVVEETIPVRGGDAQAHRVRLSPLGPVIELADGVATTRDWTVYRESRTVLAVREFQRAASAEELLDTARDFTSPGQNIIAADVDGHIGYRAAGSIPDRPARAGRLPTDAGQEQLGWARLADPDASPRLLDPDRGYIVTANNQIGRGNRAMALSTFWSLPARAERIEQVLADATDHDVESMTALQNDIVSAVSLRVLAALPSGPLVDPEAQRWWARLRSWDGSYRTGPEPTVFEVFHRELERALFEDDAGEGWVHGARGLLKATGAYRFDAIPPELAERDWFDDLRTVTVETREQIVERALTAALARLTDRFGANPSSWSWELRHTVTLPHPLGRLPVVGRLFDIGPRAVAGTVSTVNANGARAGDDFRVSHIPVFRMVVDLDDLRRSQIVNSSGQSGHPLSPHYDDQFDTWVEGRYRPMLYAEEDIAANVAATLRLVTTETPGPAPRSTTPPPASAPEGRTK